MTKTCSICNEEKDISRFNVFTNGNNPNYIDTRCKECKNKSTKFHRDTKREKYLERARRNNTNSKCKRHGVTLEWLDAKTIEQNGVCAICHQKSERRLSIDHNHTTNVARGLLCQKCNFFIGLANDNLDILSNAIVYLDKYK